MAAVPTLSGLPTSDPTEVGEAAGRRFPLSLLVGGGTLAVLVAGGLLYYFTSGSSVDRQDLLLHTVQRESLDLTVTERGTLESADNRDIVCKVKAGSKGNYASTIKWVIDDGTLVKKGQLLMVLDSSALEDQFRTQRIAVDKSQAEWVAAEQQYRIQISTNESAIEKAKSDIQLAELDLESYAGLPKGTLSGRKRDAAQALLTALESDLESFLARHQADFPNVQGEYHKSLNDLAGQVELADADVEMWKDRLAYSQRMQLKGYLSPAQVQADESRLAGAVETLKKIRTDKQLLQMFLGQRKVKELSAKVLEAWRAYERAMSEATANEVKAEATRRTSRSIYLQEEEKLKEIEDQIRNCKLYAPQDGMVVYYIPEGSRWSQSERGVIQQGATVQEGQKMMRIPDLSAMQVATNVHEAMVSHIRGDVRRSTGVHESVLAASLVNPNPVQTAMALHDTFVEDQRELYRSREYYEAARGQEATIRTDAFPTQPLKGHVRSVATVASSNWWSSEVRVYSTVVSIDEHLPGLKPGMSAEVTIHVRETLTDVLVIPVQAIVGGAESGGTRKVLVLTPQGPEERQLEIGLSNEMMAEVKSGLAEGDQVVVNPQALLGAGAKTRDGAPGPAPKGPGGKGKGAAGKKGGGKAADPKG